MLKPAMYFRLRDLSRLLCVLEDLILSVVFKVFRVASEAELSVVQGLTERLDDTPNIVQKTGQVEYRVVRRNRAVMV